MNTTIDPASKLPADYFPSELNKTLIESASEIFAFGRGSLPGIDPVRFALIPGKKIGVPECPGPQVPCISDMRDNPDGWKLFKGGVPSAAYHNWRTEQVVANAPYFKWGHIERPWEGSPCYIFGNGPSAEPLAKMMPDRWDRNGIVMAINGAATLFEDNGGPDAWFVADALWPKGRIDWLEEVIYQWGRWNPEGVKGFFSLYANHQLVKSIHNWDGRNVSFYQPANDNPHRHSVDPKLKIPRFIEGLQGAVSAVHLAWHMGASPIVLCGFEQSKLPGETYHAGAPTVGWREGFESKNWFDMPGMDGPVRMNTCGLAASYHLMGACFWCQESGVPVFNLSRGIDIVGAPRVAPEVLLRLLE